MQCYFFVKPSVVPSNAKLCPKQLHCYFSLYHFAWNTQIIGIFALRKEPFVLRKYKYIFLSLLFFENHFLTFRKSNKNKFYTCIPSEHIVGTQIKMVTFTSFILIKKKSACESFEMSIAWFFIKEHDWKQKR